MPTTKDSILLTVEDLATRWRKSPATIRSDASRAPHSLPAIVRLPGQNRLLWRRETVEAFEAASEVTAIPPPPKVTKRRGRPTNAERRARRVAEASP